YALACMLFQCLTGAKPFSAENALAVMYMHLTNEPPRPSEVRPGVSAAFDRVIAQGMAKSPDERFATAGELAAAAQRALIEPGTKRLPTVPITPPSPPASPPMPARKPARANRRGWLTAAATAAVVALMGVAVFIWGQSDRQGQKGASAPSSSSSSSSSSPATATSAPAPGVDLGLAVPLDVPACDGGYIVIVGSAVNPNAYATDVREFLKINVGAKYLHAPTTGCSSLRTHVGTVEIYSVFYGPYRDKNVACNQKAAVKGDSFVRRLDTTSTPDRAVSCG
ncbi:MAG: serine/threonine protein kinase, partial [Kibdelosporangium sp.]